MKNKCGTVSWTAPEHYGMNGKNRMFRFSTRGLTVQGSIIKRFAVLVLSLEWERIRGAGRLNVQPIENNGTNIYHNM